MVTSFLIMIYITLICWGWGSGISVLLKTTTLFSKMPGRGLPVYCMLGLSGVMVAGNLLSYVAPLDHWLTHLLLALAALPGILLQLKEKPVIRFAGGSRATNFLLAAGGLVLLLLLLQYHSHSVVHPDTLGYHAQLIRWIESHAQVPGIANLDTRFGLQSNWFVGCAIFSFRFSGIHALTFLNLAVLSWFVIFLLLKIRVLALSPAPRYATLFICLLLLATTFINHTQVRLTASSASPDFIAAIFILLVFYLSYRVSIPDYRQLVPVLLLFIMTTVTIKFSTVPLLILPLLMLVAQRFKALRETWIWGLVFTLLVLLPALGRNYIASGYPLYPSRALAVGNPDWRVLPERADYVFAYVAAYARMKSSDNAEEIFRIAHAPVEYWLPVWWQQRTGADRFLLVALLALVAGTIILSVLRKKIRDNLWRDRVLIVTLLICLIFWFCLGPDPRFGYGFLLALSGLLLKNILDYYPLHPRVSKQIVSATAIACFLLLLAFTGYRFQQHYEDGQWLVPVGVKEVPFHAGKNGIATPDDEPCSCAGTPVPCGCNPESVQPRGKTPADGFRARAQ